MTAANSIHARANEFGDSIWRTKTHTDVSARSNIDDGAALKGASFAFAGVQHKPAHQVKAYSGRNGAFEAATKATLEPSQTSKAGNTRVQGPKLSDQDRATAKDNRAPSVSAAQHSVTSGYPRSQSRYTPSLSEASSSTLSLPSASHAAATLAAARRTPQPSTAMSRSTSRSPTRAEGHNVRHGELVTPVSVLSDVRDRSKSLLRSPVGFTEDSRSTKARQQLDDPKTDETPIESTSSLIGRFQQTPSGGSRASIRKQTPPVPMKPLKIKSPKPIRPLSLPGTSLDPGVIAVSSSAETSRSPDLASQRTCHANTVMHQSFVERLGPPARSRSSREVTTANDLAQNSIPEKTMPPQLPPPRKSIKSSGTQDLSRQDDGTRSSVRPGSTQPKSLTNPLNVGISESSSSIESSVLPSEPYPKPSSRSATSKVMRSSSKSVDDLSTNPAWNYRPRKASHGFQPTMTEGSLADAMVASSLASSRATSPSKSPAPHTSRHASRGNLLPNSSQTSLPRTPSPAKGMRQTMRKPAKSDDENEVSQHNKKFFGRKHPNKHHEGDRKRWRDKLTDRERKRYEGVWAANRDATSMSGDDMVPNYVVRDVWSRSRLRSDILEEVWELVDRQRLGGLNRDEYVVGMWLIDQRLRGRKLPISVSQSVWDSVGHLSGVKIPRYKK